MGAIHGIATVQGVPTDGVALAAYSESTFDGYNYEHRIAAALPANYWPLKETGYDFVDLGIGTSGDYEQPSWGQGSGSILYGQAGIPGAVNDPSIWLDGTSAYIEFPQPPNIYLGFQNHDFTIEAWVNPYVTTPGYAEYWFLFGNTAGGSGDDYLQVGQVNDGNGNPFAAMKFWADDFVDATIPLVYGAWNHVVCTFHASTKLGSIYVNGTLASTHTFGGTLTVPSNATARVARFEHGGTIEYWSGQIAHLAHYGAELSAATISQHYGWGATNLHSTLLNLPMPVLGSTPLLVDSLGEPIADATALSGPGFGAVGAYLMVVGDYGDYWVAHYDPASLTVYEWEGPLMPAPHTSRQTWTAAVDRTASRGAPLTTLSAGVTLPVRTLPVVSTSFFVASGMLGIIIPSSGGSVVPVRYAGQSGGTSFTKCAGGQGQVFSAGAQVVQLYQNHSMSRRLIHGAFALRLTGSGDEAKLTPYAQAAGAWHAETPAVADGAASSTPSNVSPPVACIVDPGGYYYFLPSTSGAGIVDAGPSSVMEYDF